MFPSEENLKKPGTNFRSNGVVEFLNTGVLEYWDFSRFVHPEGNLNESSVYSNTPEAETVQDL
jgi:hypothetical protein